MAWPVSSPARQSTTAADTAAGIDEGEPAGLEQVAAVPDERGVHDARAHRVDGDVVLGQLRYHRPDQPHHRVLGQAVDGVGREADQSGQRGGGHDGAPAPGRQGGHQGPRPVDHPVDVDRHDPAVGVVAEGRDVGLPGHHPGVEVGQVDATETGGDGLDDPRPLVRAAHIGLQPQPTDGRGGPRCGRSVEVDHRDRHARVGQAGGGGQADPRSAAGDHRHSSGQVSHGLPHLLC